ncbi:MAG: hypothetical protein AMS18_14710 [Gemmatimonas sp. SG8_17]|nr:MAG: hypothetical protein AMS18_14710 [Gemmatimonas sp. SG8_17]
MRAFHQVQIRNSLLSAAVAVLTSFQAACSEQADISFFVLVKSNNYSQDSLGQLTFLNYHFFSEIFVQPGGRIDSASLALDGVEREPIPYVDRGNHYYVEGGHFNSLEELDAAYPNVVDSRIVHGVPGFTSYATATYFDLRTTGAVSDPTCPAVSPPMDTGQTDRNG